MSLKADRVATRVCESRHTKNRFISLVLSVLCLLSNECWSEPHLREVAKESGVEFTHLSGREGELWTVEITGAGVGVLDYDNDGKLDIYAIQGGPLRDRSGLLPSDRIYRNTSVEGELKFEDVTEATGIASIANQYGMGIATGDIDSDGDVDVFLANFGKNQLLENVDGVFVDISDESDFGEETWSISASFGDYNDDGLLDLYVANYLNFPEFDSYRPCRRLSTRLSYCAPSNFSPVEDRLYLNNGDGKFIDYTEQSGISSVAKPGMGVVSVDLNSDGLLDIYVANDMGENFLWINQGEGVFKENGLMEGVAVNGDGRREASMGIAVGDYDLDDDFDLYVTHDIKESNTLYRNQDELGFEDRTSLSGLSTPSLPNTGFGAEWFDVESDGDLDLLVANGSVSMIESQIADGIAVPLRQSNQLMVNSGDGDFLEVDGGTAFKNHQVSRGLALGDLDNDGDSDAVINNNDGRLTIYLNESTLNDTQRGMWLGVELVDHKTRNVNNAMVRLIQESVQLRRVHTDGSYGSAKDPRVLFGLGTNQSSQTIEVTWLDGAKERFEKLIPNQYHQLVRTVD